MLRADKQCNQCGYFLCVQRQTVVQDSFRVVLEQLVTAFLNGGSAMETMTAATTVMRIKKHVVSVIQK